MLESANQAIDAVATVVEAIGQSLAGMVEVEGRLSRGKLDEIQPQAFELARCLAELDAAKAFVAYAEKLGREYEGALANVYVARTVRTLSQTLTFQLDQYGLSPEAICDLPTHRPFVEEHLSVANLNRLADIMLERETERGGSYGLSPDHVEMNQVFARFADDRVAPLAEHIHRHDQLIPEDLLQDLAELGVFGISIPEEYGGHFMDHMTMCIATEELSRASLGAGGSVITRPEICAKALLKGGTEEQKQKWLPAIAAGERIVSIAVTEPNAGSDVASLAVTARETEGGYLLNGEKTWCTFAGRADLMLVLARTGKTEDGHRGLTLFLADKPVHGAGEDEHHWNYEQPTGGTLEGHAIPTVGYRGMHSFTVTFTDYFVPQDYQIGELGQGFKLQMKGFAGGRIQTAARAIGVMEAAYRQAVSYIVDRKVFGKALATYSLPRAKVVEMAARVQACRQFTYAVAAAMDEGKGQLEASLVKLMSCKEAEWVTREAMQLHGGMGYSEEYSVSRYWQDARVLSIFEGAEEILAIYVVARQYLSGLIGR